MKPVELNLFTSELAGRVDEAVQPLVVGNGLRLERIVSHGQVSPPGFWYDQAEAEWVTVLRGGARIRIDGQADVVMLRAGDSILLPAHCRHRVEWTDPDQPTIWLALYFDGELSEDGRSAQNTQRTLMSRRLD